MDSELYKAVIEDNIDVLKQMDDKLDDQLTPTNNTVLHHACQYGSINCVKDILVAHGVLLLKKNLRDETALHLAARHGHYDVAVELIAAAKSSVLQTMLREKNVEHETALHAAVRYNHQVVVQLLVKEDPSHEHPLNKNNESPVYLATARGYTEIIEKILHCCRSPTFGGPHGRTALHAAVLDKNQGNMELLLAKKKDLITVADNYGWTVYHFVACNNLHNFVEYLVSVDKSVGYLTDKEHKKTPIHIAASEGNLEVMKELIKYYPDSLEVVDGNGQNILHIAAEKDNRPVIVYILSLGFKTCNNLLIQKDKNGNTPLHMLAKLGHRYDQLMDLTAELDWQVLDHKNHTPLDVLKMTDTQLAEQDTIGRVFDRNKIRKYWPLWRLKRRIQLDEESDGKLGKEQRLKENNTLINTHMIVAALITTVALTAGFAMPGGFEEKTGYANLSSTAFKAFAVTDAIALLFSISSLFLYFVSTFSRNEMKVWFLLYVCAFLNCLSVLSMMLAFITGTYAVLKPELSKIAITVCITSSLFILLVVIVLARSFKFLKNAIHALFIL